MLKLSKRKILILIGERDLTIKGLAERIGVTPNNLSATLGRGTCYPATAGRIATALHVPVELILED